MLNNRPQKRYYGLMWAFIVLLVLTMITIAISYDKHQNTAGAFGMAMFGLGAIHAYQGKISSAKWLIGFLLALQIISLLTRMVISQDIFSLVYPGITREVSVISSLLTTLVLALMFFYAHSLERSEHNNDDYLEQSWQSQDTQSNKSDFEQYSGRNSNKAIAQNIPRRPDELVTSTGKSYMELNDIKNARKLAKKYGYNSPADDPWETAVEYFPDIKRFYDVIRNIDPNRADQFKFLVLEERDFKNSSHVYRAVIEEIIIATCGSKNKSARDFLSRSIAIGNIGDVKRLIELSKVLGPDNVTNDVIEKFKGTIR